MCNPELKERYVNFYTDFAFKKLFGTEVNKELLISFLNSLFDGIEVIKDLKYLNVEHLGAAAAERKAVFDAVFQRFFEQAEIANFTPQELSDYRESQKDYWDLFSVVETAENKGIARGLEEGIAIGEERGIAIGEERGIAIGEERQRMKQEQERIASILSFRKLGLSDEQIAAGLNLPLEYVQQH